MFSCLIGVVLAGVSHVHPLTQSLLQGPLPITAPIIYDDVSQRIYGMAAKSWKEKYQLKATDEDTTKYNASKSYHAVHGPSALDAIDAVAVPAQANPCCRESTEPLLPLALPSLPVCLPADDTALSVGILTVSDRASAGAYQDESGPMIAKCLRDFEAKNPSVGVLLVHQKVSISSKCWRLARCACWRSRELILFLRFRLSLTTLQALLLCSKTGQAKVNCMVLDVVLLNPLTCFKKKMLSGPGGINLIITTGGQHTEACLSPLGKPLAPPQPTLRVAFQARGSARGI